MPIIRRDFIKKGIGLVGSLGLSGISLSNSFAASKKPVIVSTWNHGLTANKVGWEILEKGGTSLDAVESGVIEVENDPNVQTVGIGGRPDRTGKVTLDACIMDHDSSCGAVAFLENIANPIAVARKVMEKTPHVMLVGEGAFDFAIAEGFKKEDLLTASSKAEWKKWLKDNQSKSRINIENHDTISTLALDASGRLAGACTTSGAAWKMNGRIGDSPIIGAGLFLDGKVGGAAATGLGEAVIRTAGSAMVVEAMRSGSSPQEACEKIVKRIIDKHPNEKELQVGFIALDINGNMGSYSIQSGFTVAACDAKSGHTVVEAKSMLKS